MAPTETLLTPAVEVSGVPVDVVEAVADAVGIGVHEDTAGGFGCVVSLSDGRALVLLSGAQPRPCRHSAFDGGRCVLCGAVEVSA